MKLLSLVESRTESLTVNINLQDLKKAVNTGKKSFHFKWLQENRFVISLNFSFGTNIIFDTNYPNTKSDIIFYGAVSEKEKSKTEIILKTRSKFFLASLMIILPLVILISQTLIKLNILIFFFALLMFPFFILGVLIFVMSEENRLLGLFRKFLDNEIC